MNKVFFIGRVASDIDTRVNGEHQTARFSIAVDRKTRDRKTDFFRIVAFGKTAELIGNHFKKGNRIAVEATAVKPDKYTNHNGQTIYPDIEFWVSTFDFIETKAEAQQNQGYPAPQAPAQVQAPTSQPQDNGFMNIPDNMPDVDELPFS